MKQLYLMKGNKTNNRRRKRLVVLFYPCILLYNFILNPLNDTVVDNICDVAKSNCIETQTNWFDLRNSVLV